MSFFALKEADKLAASPRQWNPSSTNVYRGYFPSSADGKEGLDLGDPQIHPPGLDIDDAHLLESNRLPECLGPKWHEDVELYFDAFFKLGGDIVRAMIASLGGDPARATRGFARPPKHVDFAIQLLPRVHISAHPFKERRRRPMLRGACG